MMKGNIMQFNAQFYRSSNFWFGIVIMIGASYFMTGTKSHSMMWYVDAILMLYALYLLWKGILKPIDDKN